MVHRGRSKRFRLFSPTLCRPAELAICIRTRVPFCTSKGLNLLKKSRRSYTGYSFFFKNFQTFCQSVKYTPLPVEQAALQPPITEQQPADEFFNLGFTCFQV